jgi:hypothetical protein
VFFEKKLKKITKHEKGKNGGNGARPPLDAPFPAR